VAEFLPESNFVKKL